LSGLLTAASAEPKCSAAKQLATMASEPSASSSKPSSGDCFDAHDAAELRTEVGNVQLKRVAIQLPIVLTSAVAGGGLKGVNALGSIEIMIAAHAGNGAALLKEAGVDRTDAAGVKVAERLKEDAINDGEDGRVEADADGQSEHRGCREGAGTAIKRISPEFPEGRRDAKSKWQQSGFQSSSGLRIDRKGVRARLWLQEVGKCWRMNRCVRFWMP
jgi:hypothetical protein